MVKLKTHSGAKKRLRRLKSGLLKGAHTGRRKLLAKKTAKRKRALRMKYYVCKADAACLLKVLPR